MRYRLAVSITEAEAASVRALLGGDGRAAYEGGAAPLLLKAFSQPVAAVLVAERAPAYLTVLYGLLLLRRGHELEPLHEDVERFVAPAAQALDAPYGEEALARDLSQLADWGCVERRTEPLKIRGYKDVRRERYRYRLTDEAVALLEWVEGRLQALLEGRRADSRDLLIDLLGFIKELARVVGQWHEGRRTDDAPRRALYLLTVIDDRVRAISEELVGFRASMVAFASRPYDIRALRAILGYLERYVAVYLGRIEELRAEIIARLAELGAPRHQRALSELHGLVVRERLETPLAFRAVGVLRTPGDNLEAQRLFFAHRGQLTELCARIDESARAVLRKMYRHLRELERRSARIEDLRARIQELAALPHNEPRRGIAEYANSLIGSAHGRFGRRGAGESGRTEPPMPRQHTASAARPKAPPLARKLMGVDALRELRSRRLALLRIWLAEEVLRGERARRLGEAELVSESAPRRWLDVARALHLDRGRDLGRLGVTIEERPGDVCIGTPACGLRALDCLVSRVDEGAKERSR